MNRTALITGTTSGIGAAFCDLLTKEKYNLILVSRDANALSKQAEFLRTETAVHIFCYNLSDAKVLKKIFEHVTAARLSVDILINNAGFNEAGYIIDTNLAKELEMVQVHINHHADRYAVGMVINMRFYRLTSAQFVVIIPHVIVKLLPAEHLSRMFGHKIQYVKLDPQQFQRNSLH